MRNSYEETILKSLLGHSAIKICFPSPTRTTLSMQLLGAALSYLFPKIPLFFTQKKKKQDKIPLLSSLRILYLYRLLWVSDGGFLLTTLFPWGRASDHQSYSWVFSSCSFSERVSLQSQDFLTVNGQCLGSIKLEPLLIIIIFLP